LSTWLKVNFQKSCMLPINILDEEVNGLVAAFGCQVGSFPLLTWGYKWVQPYHQSLILLLLWIDWKGC
jgi:hypothetical protein